MQAHETIATGAAHFVVWTREVSVKRHRHVEHGFGHVASVDLLPIVLMSSHQTSGKRNGLIDGVDDSGSELFELFQFQNR